MKTNKNNRLGIKSFHKIQHQENKCVGQTVNVGNISEGKLVFMLRALAKSGKILPLVCSSLWAVTEKTMAPHSSTLAWKIPWTEEPGGLQSMGSLRVGHYWETSLSLFTFTHWRRKWQPTPVFLPGESQGQRAWRASVYGVVQSQTRLKRLSSSSSMSYNRKCNPEFIRLKSIRDILSVKIQKPRFISLERMWRIWKHGTYWWEYKKVLPLWKTIWKSFQVGT